MADGATPQPPPRPPRGTVRRELASFGWALRGLRAALATERHLRFHALATVVVVVLAVVLPLAAWERVTLGLAIGLVWVAELVNTALESLVDLVQPEHHPVAGRVKDVAAGAVLVAAVVAVGVGVAVVGPALLRAAAATAR
ncbi:diacylglycerol kinase [uncultured Cellulomonas sp.]|uniref:diacylglycerol kinase n=1 Tax=uncultured Cellulomonas sp. TaxID=189682 RepID=UPI002636256D|nr:diacylglycerol kinase family protein [uncultured Cellulomonas sp.]